MTITATHPSTAQRDIVGNLREALALKADIAALQGELSRVTEALAESVGNATGKHTVPGVGSFTVSENNAYSEAVIREALSPGQIRRVSKTVLDKAVVKRLYPKAYEASKENKGVKVSIG